jgi:hypothetical protein
MIWTTPEEIQIYRKTREIAFDCRFLLGDYPGAWHNPREKSSRRPSPEKDVPRGHYGTQ